MVWTQSSLASAGAYTTAIYVLNGVVPGNGEVEGISQTLSTVSSLALAVDPNGYAFTAVNAAQQVVGLAGAQRFPNYLNFSPGLEWRFHFRGQYLGLRGVMENATDSRNPAIVNNVVDSPAYGMFSEGPIDNPNDLGPAIKRAIEVVKKGEPAMIDVVTQPR